MTVKISALSAATTPAGTEAVPIVQGGATVRTTVDAIALKSKTLAELNTQVSDATLIDTGDSRLSDSRAPTAHALGGALHTAATLAELNALVSDATLIDTADSRLSDARAPTAHGLDAHGTATLAELNAVVSDASLARTDAANTFTGAQTISTSIVLGGHAITDTLISSDGASTSDTVYVTPGWIDANVGGGGVSDHGALTGLGDDDHTQYVLADGTRAISGVQQFANGSEALPGIRFSVATAGFSYNVAGRIHASVGGATQIEISTTFSRFNGDLLPKTTNIFDLGGTSNRWGEMWTGLADISGALKHSGSTAGFYNTTPIAQQTGVGTDAASIHAALVALGLITA